MNTSPAPQDFASHGDLIRLNAAQPISVTSGNSDTYSATNLPLLREYFAIRLVCPAI
jgi:hypothetical protein